MTETFALFAFQGLWETLAVFSVMPYPAMFIVAAVFVLLRMMLALQRMADSMERIEEIVRREKRP